jgi:hypothetical protein
MLILGKQYLIVAQSGPSRREDIFDQSKEEPSTELAALKVDLENARKEIVALRDKLRQAETPDSQEPLATRQEAEIACAEGFAPNQAVAQSPAGTGVLQKELTTAREDLHRAQYETQAAVAQIDALREMSERDQRTIGYLHAIVSRSKRTLQEIAERKLQLETQLRNEIAAQENATEVCSNSTRMLIALGERTSQVEADLRTRTLENELLRNALMGQVKESYSIVALISNIRQAYETSTCWRITAPVRALKVGFRMSGARDSCS